MKVKLLAVVAAAVLVTAFGHAVEKSKRPTAARPVTAVAPGVALQTGPIAAPVNLHVNGPNVASSTTMDLSWMDMSNNEANFHIARTYANNPGSQAPLIAVLPANATKYHDTGLDPETKYKYVVAASRGDQWSTAVEAIGMTNPRPPKNLQAKALSGKKIQVTFQNGSNVADLIVLERSTGSPGAFQKIFQGPATTSTSYVDEGLTPQTKYFYRLLSLKLPFNFSDYTPHVGVTTLAPQ